MAFPSSVPTRKFILRYRGLFDFDGLYNMMAEYMKANRYWFHEYKYKHKVPSPLGAEQEIFWRGEKKVTDYIQYQIYLDFHLWEMTEVMTKFFSHLDKRRIILEMIVVPVVCRVEV